MKDKGVLQSISFSAQNLDLHECVLKYAEKKHTTVSDVHMRALRQFFDNQLTTQEILNIILEKIDNLSLVSVPIEQSEQVKKEIKETFNLGDNLFG